MAAACEEVAKPLDAEDTSLANSSVSCPEEAPFREEGAYRGEEPSPAAVLRLQEDACLEADPFQVDTAACWDP